MPTSSGRIGTYEKCLQPHAAHAGACGFPALSCLCSASVWPQKQRDFGPRRQHWPSRRTPAEPSPVFIVRHTT